MTIYVHKMPGWRSEIVAVLRLFTHLVRMIETVVALAARVEKIGDFKVYDGKPLRRRRSNKIIRRTKQRESVIFSAKGNLNTVLVLYTTPAWAFSRLQDDVNSQRRELFFKIDFNTDTIQLFSQY